MNIKAEFSPKAEAIIDHLTHELAGLRTGRATPALVEDILVEQYGAKLPLKQLASISVPEPRTLLIHPWDKAALSAIEKAIAASELSLAPVVDGDQVRISIPQLTEERRGELTKLAHAKMEDARIALRREREEIWKNIQEEERAGRIREDEKFRLKDELEKFVKDANEKIDELGKRKEGEIMAV
ncbi:ribosome recycling factor [Candidatus Azambacteria bacterium]|nr:ribosome recycling factor [Candidatus Azambacteria bacterium]